ncbi:Panacea domain-containing protein [Candidatus Mycoplasma pogonae]
MQIKQNENAFYAQDFLFDFLKYCFVNKKVDNDYLFSILWQQKIFYFLQGYMLKRFKMVFFKDNFLAWNFGPAIYDLYALQKTNEKNMKPEYLEKWEWKNKDFFTMSQNELTGSLKKMREVLDEVLKKYGDTRPYILVEKTHMENGAWDKTFKNSRSLINIEKQIIDVDLILEEFSTNPNI